MLSKVSPLLCICFLVFACHTSKSPTAVDAGGHSELSKQHIMAAARTDTGSGGQPEDSGTAVRSGDGSCGHTCPAPHMVFAFTAEDGGSLSGVEATLSGEKTAPLSCTPRSETVTNCSSPGGFAPPGTYSLHVTAPGFRAKDANVNVMTTNPSCGCVEVHLNPSTIILARIRT
jgi:hypothetical protein